MNVRLPEALSQTHGASGLAMIQAILEGECNAKTLLSYCTTDLISLSLIPRSSASAIQSVPIESPTKIIRTVKSITAKEVIQTSPRRKIKIMGR